MRFNQIYEYCESNKPVGVFLEVGTWDGRNALRLFSEGIQKYIGFDIWEDGDEELDQEENNAKKRVSLEQVQKTLDGKNVELYKGNTRTIGFDKGSIPKYIKDKDPHVDVALIDGGHSKGTIRSDLLNVMKIMKPDGVIFLDDYYYNCPIDNVGSQCVLAEMNFPYTVLPVGETSNGGYVIKIAQVNMRDVPIGHKWDMGDRETWSFNPGGEP